MIAQLRLKYARSLELISSLEAEHAEVQVSLELELSAKTSQIETLSNEVIFRPSHLVLLYFLSPCHLSNVQYTFRYLLYSSMCWPTEK
jgi:hypothetical protein